MWTPKPNGSAIALNSPASATAQSGPEGDSERELKCKLNERLGVKHFPDFRGFSCLLA